MLVVENGLVDVGGGCFRAADLLVEDGRIAAVGEVDRPDGAEVVDARGCAVLPGLVNAHTHSNENWLRGLFDNLPLEVWLLFAYPLRHAPRQTRREIYVRTALGALEMARGGTTSVVDFLYELPRITEESLDAVAQAYRDVGIRALICLAVADRSFYESAALELGLLTPQARAELDGRALPSAAEWIAGCRKLVERCHDPDGGISIGLAPAGPHRCSDELLMACRELADELDLQVHTHTLETRVQVRAEEQRHGRPVIEHLAEIGFLGPRVHLTHGVWLSPRDVEVIAAAGSSVVHNPISNLKLGSGVAPVAELRDQGVPLALGTDGVCSGDGQDMFQAVKLAALVHKSPERPYERWVGAQDAWEMATRGGARAMGDADLGSLAPGRRADLVLVDLDHPRFTPLNDPLLHVALQVPTDAVRDVFVNGDRIVRDGAVAGVDAAALLAEARAFAPHVLASHAAAFELAREVEPSVAAGWRREVGLAT